MITRKCMPGHSHRATRRHCEVPATVVHRAPSYDMVFVTSFGRNMEVFDNKPVLLWVISTCCSVRPFSCCRSASLLQYLQRLPRD